MSINEALENILIAKGIAPTAMRILVLEFFQQQSFALSLPDLEKEFKHSDRTTLYRTLKTFEEKALIHQIRDGGGAAKYAICAEACKAGDHFDLHLHFFCFSCKQTFCLPKTRVPDLKVPDDFELKELQLIAKGICDRCR